MLGTEAIGEHTFGYVCPLRTLLEGFLDTSWAIKYGADVLTSYKIFNQAEIDTATKIFAQGEKDLSWVIKDLGVKSLAYKIFNHEQLGVAWKIYEVASGYDTSYKIFNGEDIPTSVKIFTIDPVDTSWAIGIDNPVLDTAIFNMINRNQTFSGSKVDVIFNEEDATIIFMWR